MSQPEQLLPKCLPFKKQWPDCVRDVTFTQAQTLPSGSSKPGTEKIVTERIPIANHHISSLQKPCGSVLLVSPLRAGEREAQGGGDLDKATQLGGRGWVFNSDISTPEPKS